MEKNDFDLDFDFEKEYGFDPNLFLSSGDDDLDLDQFLNEDTTAEAPEAAEVPAYTPPTDDTVIYRVPEKVQEPAAEEDEDLASDFVRPPVPAEQPPVQSEEPEFPTEEYPEEEALPPYEEEEEEPAPRKKPGIKLPKVNLKLPAKKQPTGEPAQPNVFSKLLDAYLEPLSHRASEADDLDPLDPRVIRRKKREKKRIFKEVYLPAIIAGVAMFLILSFFVGAVANLVRAKKAESANQKLEQQAQVDAADRAEREFSRILLEIDELAKGYDYDAAIQKLDDFASTTDKFASEVTAKRAELVNQQASLLEWKDTSTIPNLSFHVLIADTTRAFNAELTGNLHGQYNRNFVTTDEFARILNQLYTGNYVLVDFNSFIDSTTGVDGNPTFFAKSLFLPQGKKPIMITETMVNYFQYMVDPDKDGTPDAKGHGFANRLVVDAAGDIKAAYIDASGNELIGNYDLVPILEDFIAEHPDFSYRGARAILAVTGDEGIFGYRTNTSFVASISQTFYDEQVIAAKQVVEALRNKGYTLASYTYSNAKYKDMSTAQIQAEMNSWTSQVTPVLGDVDVMVFARASDIDAYSGTSFNVLYSTGFRYFLNSGTSPRVDTNTTFVKQTRLMVTGEAMAWYSNQFTPYFDCNMVLDLAARGNVPKS